MNHASWIQWLQSKQKFETKLNLPWLPSGCSTLSIRSHLFEQTLGPITWNYIHVRLKLKTKCILTCDLKSMHRSVLYISITNCAHANSYTHTLEHNLAYEYLSAPTVFRSTNEKFKYITWIFCSLFVYRFLVTEYLLLCTYRVEAF